jgi:hypothetical protein
MGAWLRETEREREQQQQQLSKFCESAPETKKCHFPSSERVLLRSFPSRAERVEESGPGSDSWTTTTLFFHFYARVDAQKLMLRDCLPACLPACLSVCMPNCMLLPLG